MPSYQEALEYARSRKVVLPAEYYGLKWAKYRAMGFSIAGIASIDQLQRVKDSLDRALRRGETFTDWKKRQSVQTLRFPKGRLDNIYRTNIQGAYEAGRCRVLRRFPYLEYSAVNDSRTRPSHAAMDGTILPADHKWWKTHRPPNGFRCRCTVIGVTEAEAKKRGVTSVPTAAPDRGWDYSICQDGQEEGLLRSINERQKKCGQTLSASMIALEPLWCKFQAWQEAMQRYKAALKDWGERNRLLREIMSEQKYSEHARAVEKAAAQAGIELEQGIIVRAYTDNKHRLGEGSNMPVYTAMNTLGRIMAHPEEAMPFTDAQLFRAGLFVLLMDEAIAALEPTPGYYWRGVDLKGMPKALQDRWKDGHRRRRVVQYNGFTSAMWEEGAQYGGTQYQLWLENARDIALFSAKGEPEAVLPRGVQIFSLGFRDGYFSLREVQEMQAVKKNRQFTAQDESDIELMMRYGYTRERAEYVTEEGKRVRARWAEQRGKPVSEERMKRLKSIYERMQVEATAGLSK